MYPKINMVLNVSDIKYGAEYITKLIWCWMCHTINMALNVSHNKYGAECITQ